MSHNSKTSFGESKITAILPCYNHASFIAERILSVKNQTLQPSQVIFLDDCSTDDSVKIALKQFADLNINATVHLGSSNSGSSFAQWNRGIELAQHELIWIAETDDTCEPRLLESLYYAINCCDSVLAFAQSRQISESGEQIDSVSTYTSLHWPHQFTHEFCCSGNEFNAKFLTRLNAIPNASGVLFSREAFLRAGEANPEMRYCGDWDTWIRICGQGHISYIPVELNLFRCHGRTTRSEAVNPKMAAEKFACRLRAILSALSYSSCQSIKDRQLSHEKKNLPLAKMLNSPYRSDLAFAISELPWRSILEICRLYDSMINAPKIGARGWLTIALVRLLILAKHRCNQWHMQLLR